MIVGVLIIILNLFGYFVPVVLCSMISLASFIFLSIKVREVLRHGLVVHVFVFFLGISAFQLRLVSLLFRDH